MYVLSVIALGMRQANMDDLDCPYQASRRSLAGYRLLCRDYTGCKSGHGSRFRSKCSPHCLEDCLFNSMGVCCDGVCSIISRPRVSFLLLHLFPRM
jgi:hypothetical protein